MSLPLELIHDSLTPIHESSRIIIKVIETFIIFVNDSSTRVEFLWNSAPPPTPPQRLQDTVDQTTHRRQDLSLKTQSVIPLSLWSSNIILPRDSTLTGRFRGILADTTHFKWITPSHSRRYHLAVYNVDSSSINSRNKSMTIISTRQRETTRQRENERQTQNRAETRSQTKPKPLNFTKTKNVHHARLHSRTRRMRHLPTLSHNHPLRASRLHTDIWCL